ncbi:phosphate/phosphite/phosphonate ABC transporter substrate-binding protein [Thiomicrorhabdus sp. 6S3-12]|uniref:phosphate/phosphite/phosphonate ABC transporter substrate-binding protein n=1 Tax=Thiomicrorhabdus sp. 6S3-12 TaxID=2819681 RepID=UPI001AAD2659|nr:phosphate/phosphite/phosphonate ABC transporter substrate-binding protein [Thiomicrorhabdus sp. 6S3-12]MBO1923881.1 phosphate/phosphite/phosphonate ABC transporter substrate-binding protein [Thiomicrorhabdus sp. 6S3-12]
MTTFASLFGLHGCQKNDYSPQDYEPKVLDSPSLKQTEYAFAVHPLHNPSRLFELFNPLMEYLNAYIPEARFRLEASRDYSSYDQKLADASVEFALPNPYQTVTAIESGHYRVFAKMGDDHNFRGIILVRKDSGIRKVTDLKGKTISYPAPTALAATMMPQYYLYQHGLNIKTDANNIYVGSQESSIMNVLHGESDAGATWPPPWELLAQENPELKEKLEVKWQTDPLPNNGLIARNDVPQRLVTQVQRLLSEMHTTPRGREILQTIYLSRFEVADNATYQPVKDFLENFRQKIRIPEEE